MVPPSAEVLQRARAESLAASDTGLWERADEQNPDPMRFVPAQITGFNALHERRQQQVQAARDLASKLRTSHDELRKLDDERKVAIELRLRHYAERQHLLSHRVLRLYAAIERQHLLRCHGDVEPPLTPAETAWTHRLHELVSEMERPNAGLARLYDLSTRVKQDAATAGTLDGLPAASHLHLPQLKDWLARQQKAVRTLIDVSQQDLKDLQIALEEAKGGGRATPMAL